MRCPLTVICFIPAQHPDGERLFQEIASAVPAHHVVHCRSCQELSDSNLRFGHTGAVLVLFLPDRKSLEEVLSIKETLRGHDILLILPDERTETVSMGHALYPRFIGYLDGVFGHVTMVLAKMAARWDSTGDSSVQTPESTFGTDLFGNTSDALSGEQS